MTVKDLDHYQLLDLKDALFTAHVWNAGADAVPEYTRLTESDLAILDITETPWSIPDEIVLRVFDGIEFTDEDF